MSDKLESYISFLVPENQIVIEEARFGASEPFTILSIIHWAAHHSSVSEKLSKLIVKEGQDILDRFRPNNEHITSMASLTLRPDKCRLECFDDWSDYARIEIKLPYLEGMLGKKMKVMLKPANIHTDINRDSQEQVFSYITSSKVDGAYGN
jgi:hypothetical protein